MKEDISLKLRTEANEVLYDKGLLSTLKTYGKPHVSGNYLLDLMVWRDLDIYWGVGIIPETRFFELGGRIAKLLSVSRMQYRNEKMACSESLPWGLYRSTCFEIIKGIPWKLDTFICFTIESRFLSINNQVANMK